MKNWIRNNPELTALVVSIACMIPLALWLARITFHYFDEPWVCSKHGMLESTACFTGILTLLLILIHFILCAVNRKPPITCLVNLIKTVNQ